MGTDRRVVWIAGLAVVALVAIGPKAGGAPPVAPVVAAAQSARIDPANEMPASLVLPGIAPRPQGAAVRRLAVPGPWRDGTL